MALLIDTTVLIELERRKRSAAIDLDVMLGGDAALASITASEFLAGAYRSRSAALRHEREDYIEGFLRRYPVLPFGLAEARVHARLWADLTATGQMIGANDLIIAATALAHDFGVLTHNLRDFQRVPHLLVHQPGW